MLKRSFDVIAALVLLLFYPLAVFFVKEKVGFLKNIFSVLIGEKTWVGYASNNIETYKLPKLKAGVVSPFVVFDNKKTINSHKINLLYAKNYSVFDDLRIVLKGFSYLGQA